MKYYLKGHTLEFYHKNQVTNIKVHVFNHLFKKF